MSVKELKAFLAKLAWDKHDNESLEVCVADQKRPSDLPRCIDRVEVAIVDGEQCVVIHSQ